MVALVQQYQAQACAVAGHLYEAWALKDHWHEVYVASRMSRATGFEFLAGRPNLGYAQWEEAMLHLHLGVPSVLNIERFFAKVWHCISLTDIESY